MCCSVVSTLDVAGEATVVRANGFMEGVGAGMGFEGLGAFHCVAESHTKRVLLFQIFYRSLNPENNMTQLPPLS